MSTASLNRRLAELESCQPTGDDMPTVILLLPMRHDDEPAPTADDASVAFVVKGCQLARHDGESGAAFLARVEAERLRVHGDAAHPA